MSATRAGRRAAVAGRRATLLAASLGAGLGLLACVDRPAPVAPGPRPVVRLWSSTASATVTEPLDVITEAEVRLAFARARLSREGTVKAEPLPAPLRETTLRGLVDRRMMMLEVKRHGVTVDEARVKAQLERMAGDLGRRELRQRLIDTYQIEEDLEQTVRERLLVGALLQSRAHADVKVSDAEVEAAWAAIPDSEKRVAALVHASQIVVRTKEEGEEVVKLLRRGTDFAELARARSLGPEAKNGGDLGWFERGVMPEVIDETCFTLKPGQTSGLVSSEYGYHVFQVHAVEPERELDLAALRDRLRSRALHGKLQQAESDFLEAVRKRYRVERDDDVLAQIR